MMIGSCEATNEIRRERRLVCVEPMTARPAFSILFVDDANK